MKKLICITALFLFTACNEDIAPAQEAISFDEEKWKTKEGKDYPFREEMLGDLMENQGLRQLKRDEILELLGEPTRIDTNYVFYRIEQKRIGLFPLHTTTMVIQFAQDSTVNWIKVHK